MLASVDYQITPVLARTLQSGQSVCKSFVVSRGMRGLESIIAVALVGDDSRETQFAWSTGTRVAFQVVGEGGGISS